MKYKIIVDKKPRPTLTDERREYEIDIEELRYKGDVHDSLMINVEETYVMRRLKLSEYQVLTVLDNPVKEPIGDLNIELFEGENYVYFLDMSGNIFSAEYIVKNEFNDLYVLHAQMNSAIEQTAKEIELNVSRILQSYSTTEELTAMITLLADSIKEEVSKTYATNEALEKEKSERVQTANEITQTIATSKQEAIDSANASTDEKLKEYSTTEETKTIINQTAKDVEIGVNEKINDITNNIINGNFLKDLDNWTTSASAGTVQIVDKENKKYASLEAMNGSTRLIQIVPNLSTNTEYELIFNILKGDIFNEESTVKATITQEIPNSEEPVIVKDETITIGAQEETKSVKFNLNYNASVMIEFSINLSNYVSFEESVLISDVYLLGGSLNEKIANLSVKSDEINAEVKKKVDEKTITGAYLILQINEDKSEAKLNADKIELSANDVLNLLAGNEINITTKNISMSGTHLKITPDGKIALIGAAGVGDEFSVSSDKYISRIGTSGIFTGEKDVYSERFISLDTSETEHPVIMISDNDGTKTFIYSDSIETPSINPESLEEIKKNILKLNKNVLELIKNSDIYEYNLKSEEDIDKKHIGFVIGEKYKTPKEVIAKHGRSIDLYSMTSILWKGIQELSERLERLEAKNGQN